MTDEQPVQLGLKIGGWTIGCADCGREGQRDNRGARREGEYGFIAAG